MPFRYCIALDVEKTTDGPDASKEIIELAAVAYDLSKNVELDRFHSFVKPKFNPELSEFCTKLTGISQATINKSPKMDWVLAQFMKWVNNLKPKHGIHVQHKGYNANCCIITWSENDLRSLHNDLIRKNMQRPNILAVALDLQSVFAKYYAHNNIERLQNAVEQVGLKFEGTPHSAESDALNLAVLAAFMAKAKDILLSNDYVMYLKAFN